MFYNDDEENLTPAQKWEKATLADNFIFCSVMSHNLDLCRELLEMLLDIRIDYVKLVQSEKTFFPDFYSKGIRLDVYVKDGSGRSFDIEMQTVNTKNLSKRSRYYQSAIDVDNLKSGEDYEELKQSYVIFLCLFDIFGNGLPIYTFQNRCNENGSILLNDGTTKVFFNARMYDKMPTEKLRNFFKFLLDNEPAASDFTARIEDRIKLAKTNIDERRRFMTVEQEIKLYGKHKFQEGYDKAYTVAYKESAKETCVQNARKLKSKNVSAEIIAECTGLPVEKVREL